MRSQLGLHVLSALSAILLFIPVPVAHAAPREVGAIVAKRVEEAGAPGAAYAFVRADRVEAGAVGLASVKNGTAMRSNTPLALGSVSKVFTAVAVLQLVDQRLVELDAPVSRYLPWLRFADPGSADRITVRHLLNHTSGISTFVGNRTQSDLSVGPGALRRRVELLAGVTPDPPGTVWQYSNANYQILGALIEEVSGLDYRTYLQRNIFNPLGMSQSFILVPPPTIRPATGHRRVFGVLRPVDYRSLGLGSAPQGGVYASAEDMGKFLKAFIAEDSPLISNRIRSELLRPQPGAAMQGLGWRVRPGFAWHGGDSPGFAAFAGLDLRTGVGLAVMTNVGDNIVSAPAHGITLGTASEVFGLPPVPARTSPFAAGIVAVLAIATLAAIAYAARLIGWLGGANARSRSRLQNRRSGAIGIVLVLLASGVLLIPRLMFGAPISAAWVFMPDMTILLIACGISLLLAGLLELLRLFRGTAASQS